MRRIKPLLGLDFSSSVATLDWVVSPDGLRTVDGSGVVVVAPPFVGVVEVDVPPPSVVEPLVPVAVGWVGPGVGVGVGLVGAGAVMQVNPDCTNPLGQVL